MRDDWLDGMVNLCNRLADDNKETIVRFNDENKPVFEWVDEFEDGATRGLFLIGGQYYHARKYFNGYHPQTLIEIPSQIVDFLRKA